MAPDISFGDFASKISGERFDYNNIPGFLGMYGLSATGNRYEDIRLVYKVFDETLLNNVRTPMVIEQLPAGISPLIEKHDTNTLRRGFLAMGGFRVMDFYVSSRNPFDVIAEFESQATVLEGRKEKVRRDYDAFIHSLLMGSPPIALMCLSVDKIISFLLEDNSIMDHRIYM